MKRLFKQKYGVILGLLIGIVFMGGVSYAVDNLSSESVSYKKKDGNLTTVKQALDELITKSSKVDELEEKVNDFKKLNTYLADYVSIGDYIDYDAGTWTDNAEKPTKQGNFGGHIQGQSKNTSVACFETTGPKLQGWRVLSVDKDNKIVTIIHAGQPECYYHGDDPNNSVIKLNEHVQNTYLNPLYASSARAMNKNDAESINKDNTLRNTETNYWLATVYDNTNNYLYNINVGGGVGRSSNDIRASGYRPIITLKTKLLVTGKGTDEFGNTAWKIE